MEYNQIFSTSIPRSGSTMLGRILSLNSKLGMSNDAFLPVFRSFRNQIALQNNFTEFDPNDPIPDYYFLDQGANQLRSLQEASLDVPIPAKNKVNLIRDLEARADLAAPELAKDLNRLDFRSYKLLLQSGVNLIGRSLGVNECGGLAGFHENWIVEFLPNLLRAFPDALGLILIRDPRAIIASLKKLRETEPKLVPSFYSVLKHWRKLVILADMFLSGDFNKRAYLVKYENLVARPEHEVRQLCDFLGVLFDTGMLDTKRFRPHQGDQWTAWSHHNVTDEGIYSTTTSKWKEVLDTSEICFVEAVCGFEMLMTGYDLEDYDNLRLATGDIENLIQQDVVGSLGWNSNKFDPRTSAVLEDRRTKMLTNISYRNQVNVVANFLTDDLSRYDNSKYHYDNVMAQRLLSDQ